MKKLFTLVAMQLADKIDFSYLKNVRQAILKIVLGLLKFVAVTAMFYLVFMLCGMFNVFGLGNRIPDTVLAVVFTVIELMSIITCTVGLTNSLYKSQDNKVLLTLPVEHNQVFFSKIILYLVYEIIKNINFTLPLFIAYGINNGAVFYYYVWLILGFLLISFLPVVIGAILSIPWLYISTFIDRYKTLQAILILSIGFFVAELLLKIVALIPSDISILTQWQTITQEVIGPFLISFTNVFSLFYKLTLMIVGGTLFISSNIFAGSALIYFVVLIGVLLVGVALAYLLAKPLFFKMASKQFEFEKKSIFGKKNHVHNKWFSPLAQDLQRNFRSSKYITMIVLQLFLPAILLFLLNKLYIAMQTSNEGLIMTKAFSMLVLSLTVLSFNNEFASIYSKDGNARYLEKTRPINPAVLTFSRLIPRIVISTISVFIATGFYATTAKISNLEFILVAITCSFLSIGHLLWCAETDIMNPQSEQYATVGMEFNNPNVRNMTIYSLLLSVFFAFLSYFIVPYAFEKLVFISLAFLVARCYLYFVRVKLYYKER